MKFTGTVWDSVGRCGFSAGEVVDLSLVITADGIPVLAYKDDMNSLKATVMKFAESGDTPLPIVNIPSEFAILNIYPNPFNPSTTISYELSIGNLVSINIYDIQGRLLETLYEGHMNAGQYNMLWDANGISSGVYLLRMQAGNDIRTQKLLLLK
jgi:hypothetical protein